METTFTPLEIAVQFKGTQIAHQIFETQKDLDKATKNSFGSLLAYVNMITSVGGRKDLPCTLQIGGKKIGFTGGKVGKSLQKSIMIEIGNIHGGIAPEIYKPIAKFVVSKMAVCEDSLNDVILGEKFMSGEISDLRNLKAVKGAGIDKETVTGLLMGTAEIVTENVDENAD